MRIKFVSSLSDNENLENKHLKLHYLSLGTIDYKQLDASRTIDASFLAVDNWATSSVESVKFDFFNQPAAEVLSVWLSIQDSEQMSPCR